MTNKKLCPICNASPSKRAFPYAIHYNKQQFNYYRCGDCSSVFVDPSPDKSTFAKMYAKSDYHDLHYDEQRSNHYNEAVELLKSYSTPGSLVLDYGCGIGHFLKAACSAGFGCFGVEFDRDAATSASLNAGCDVVSLEEFSKKKTQDKFDVIHIGDVLEHLPYPAETLVDLLTRLRPGGLLFVEGPLEINPSPVYWASSLFGSIRHLFRPTFVGQGKPTHLFRTGSEQQLKFFNHVSKSLHLLRWEVYETGWPYINQGFLKSVIARAAIFVSGKKVFGSPLGNRFIGVFRLDPAD
jgi:2-polyprenyl-3-methyl-5-hydroxy-6-metoxy-1,4-benzoquinol methylase